MMRQNSLLTLFEQAIDNKTQDSALKNEHKRMQIYFMQSFFWLTLKNKNKWQNWNYVIILQIIDPSERVIGF